jgi:ComF family protein
MLKHKIRPHRVVDPFLTLFLESRCALCQRSSPDHLCLYCQRQIQRDRIINPQVTWQAPLPVFSWGLYSGSLKRAIATLKYENQPQLAELLGQWLAQSWLDSPISQGRSLRVVPIPMHSKKRAQRGYDQAELLAASFCRVTQLPFDRRGLLRVRETEAQFKLSASEREQNLMNAFQVSPSSWRRWGQHPDQGEVLLLDDVYTTGATARAAVERFRQHNIVVFGVVALARPTYDGCTMD